MALLRKEVLLVNYVLHEEGLPFICPESSSIQLSLMPQVLVIGEKEKEFSLFTFSMLWMILEFSYLSFLQTKKFQMLWPFFIELQR